MRRFMDLCAAGLLAGGVAVALPVSMASGQVHISVGDQVGEGGIISVKGFEAYCRILGLDETQKAAARELLEGTSAANRTASDEMRTAMAAFGEKMKEAMKKDGWPAAQKMLSDEMPVITKRYSDQRAKLEMQFFADLKGMLSEAQLAKMPAVERARRRETGLRLAPGAGAVVDLVDVLDAMKIEASGGEMGDEVGRYELRLDQLLGERERLQKESEGSLKEVLKTMDMEAIEKAQQPLKDNGVAIRDLTRLTTGKVAALLPEDRREAFEAEVKRRAFPRVYKQAYVMKAIETAEAMKDLDASQKAALAELREKYGRESDVLNKAWVRAIDSKKDPGNVRMVVNDSRMGAQEDPDKDVKAARQAREDLDEAFEKSLKGILKESQVARLPSKRPERSGSGAGGEDGEDGISVKMMVTDDGDGHVMAPPPPPK